MKSWRGLGPIAVLIWMCAGMTEAQQTPQVVKPLPVGLIHEVGPDVTAPEVIPSERTINTTEPCEETNNGEVVIWLVVDDLGKPRDITVIDSKGTALERLAAHVVKEDSFKPGASKGEAVAVKQLVQVKLEACFASKTNGSGENTKVLRLTSQPMQTFSNPSAETTEKARASLGDVELYRVGRGVSAPVALNSVEAAYTDEAKRKKIQGVCLIRVIVDSQGKPQNALVIRPLGYGLDEMAIEAVHKYRFKPAMKEGGVPVPVMITVEVNFRLY
jgi:TonB family protein